MKYLTIFNIFLALILFSCGKDDLKTEDMKFIHIMDGESSVATVSSESNSVGTYSVYLSSSTANFRDSVVVNYKISVGNGLTEGLDYKLITTGNTLTFLPGIYDMPIRIRWMSHPVDPSKNNSITIELVSNDKGYVIGLPGPSQNQKSFVITKVP